jgi:hypothetical protein
VREILRRLGSPDAISRFTVLSLLFVSMSGTLILANALYPDRLGDAILARSLSIIPMIGLLGLAKFALKSSGAVKPRPAWTIPVFIVSALAGSAVFDSLLLIQNVTETSGFLFRIFWRAAISLAVIVLTGLLVVSTRELNRKNDELEASLRMILSLRDQAVDRIAQRKSSLLEQIFTEVKLSLVSQGSHASTSESLKRLLSEVIRPLSYRLTREVPGESAEAQLPKIGRAPWLAIFREALSSNPIHPYLSGSVLVLILVPFVSISGGAQVLTSVAFLSVWIVLSYLLKLIWAKLPAIIGFGVRAGMFVLAIAVVTTLSLVAVRDLLRQVAQPWFAAGVIFCFVVSISVAMLHAAFMQLRQVSSSLAETVDELKREVILLNNGLRLMQKAMARVLHGTVQQEITLAIKKLQDATNAEEALLVASVSQERINNALEKLTEPGGTSINLSDSLRTFAELWDGSVAIALTLTKADLKIIQNRSNLPQVLDELAKEACRNAIVHGEPTNISITFSTDLKNRLVEMAVENDGKALEPSAQNGLGSQIFDDLTMRWSRTQVGALVRLAATVPF